MFAKLIRVKPLDFSSTMAKATILPLDVPIEEERGPGYHYRNFYFYLVKLGEILNDTYEIVTKVGFGSNSTIWLAQNIHWCVYIKHKSR